MLKKDKKNQKAENMKAYFFQINITNILINILPNQRRHYQNRFSSTLFLFSTLTLYFIKNRCKLRHKLCNAKINPLVVQISEFFQISIQVVSLIIFFKL